MLFVARWLSDALHLALALCCALLAMQVPALTHEYAAALDLLAQDNRRDIDSREQAARQFYNLPAGNGEADVLSALRGREPSNAATLAQAIHRAGVLQAAAARIADARPLLRPVVAGLDAVGDDAGVKLPVLREAAANHQAQVALTEPAAVYGLAGLLGGSLVARAVLGVLGRLGRRRRTSQYDFG